MGNITTKEVDNPPKFQVGDLIIGYKNDKLVVANIEEVNKFTYSQDHIDGLKEEELSRHKNCCGSGALPIYLHHYQYSTDVGIIFEYDIKGKGVETINAHIQVQLKTLKGEVKGYRKRLKKIADLV
jgi:hypothetical protein